MSDASADKWNRLKKAQFLKIKNKCGILFCSILYIQPTWLTIQILCILELCQIGIISFHLGNGYCLKKNDHRTRRDLGNLSGHFFSFINLKLRINLIMTKKTGNGKTRLKIHHLCPRYSFSLYQMDFHLGYTFS